MSESLTDVVVFPQVAHCHVARQEHRDSADAAFLHVYVLVVVSVMACNAKGQKYISLYEQQVGKVKCSLQAVSTHSVSSISLTRSYNYSQS